MGKKQASSKSSSKAIVKREVAGLPANIKFDESLMDEQDIDNKDILIPKIWLMQPMSGFVTEGKASIGEFRNSIMGELLAEKDDSLEILVFAPYKTWQVFIEKKNGKKFDKQVYLETLNYADNPDLKTDDEDDEGNLLHRDQVIGFYCLLVSDIEEDNPFPYVVDFKRTSRRAGQMIVTSMAKFRANKFPCYAKTFKLSATEQTNDHGTFSVKQIEIGRNVTQEEVTVVEAWVKTINQLKESNSVVVDDSDTKTNPHKNATKSKSNGKKKNKF